MREIENFETGMAATLGVTAVGFMGAASAIGDAVGNALRHRAYLARVDAFTRQTVRQELTAKRARASSKAKAEHLLRETAIARINARLKKTA